MHCLHGRGPFSGLISFAALSWIAVTCFAQDGGDPTFTQAQLDHFETKVRPILVARCGECHGVEAAEASGGLRLTSRKALLTGGDTGAAIVPGDADGSLLVQSIRYGGDYEMPPDSRMPDEEIAILEAWVAEGAAWPQRDDESATAARSVFDLEGRKAEHWCWTPPQRYAIPAVQDAAWPLDPLDHFILAKLEQAGIKPAPDADDASWLRRVTFDLTGLPPTVAEWEAFRDDTSSERHAQVVDRLLESPRFAERWARHWLDLVRYAETCGHEFDFPIPDAYRYRDYVIRAFDADVPYNRFVVEHLAGDLLETPRLHPTERFNESLIATGFWFLGEATHAPVDVKGDEAGRIDNQLDVMSKSFLGITVACARCHDHKFDAISTADYYALSGFLQSSRRQTGLLDPGQQIASAMELSRQLRARATTLLEQQAVAQTSREQWRRELQILVNTLASRPESGPSSEELVIADFEDGTYGDWTAEGVAFGTGPQSQETLADYQGQVGASGKFFVNSHSRRAGEVGPSDEPTGTLTSPPMTLQRRYLHFLVGGGPHVDGTCVQVLVDGTVVASQPGPASNEMIPAKFDLAQWVGREVQIRLVDAVSGGWGNIGADRFVLSDSPWLGFSTLALRQAAEREGVNPDRVEAWLGALRDFQRGELSHAAGPLSRYVRALAEKLETSPELVAQLGEQLQTELRGRAEQMVMTERQWHDNSHSLVEHDAQGAPQGFLTGQAFESPDLAAARWILEQGQWVPVSSAVVSSQLDGRKVWGVYRTPTFTIDADRIWYRIRATDVEVRVVIDGYTMHVFSGLLFSDLTKRVDTQGQMQWVASAGDLGRYKGHRAHLEIIDHGEGGFELAEVRASDTGPPGEGVDPAARTVVETPGGMQAWLECFVNELGSACEAAARGEATESHVATLRWLQLSGLMTVESDELQSIRGELEQVQQSIPAPVTVQALADGTPEDEYVFVRGNHRLLGEQVPRRDLVALGGEQWSVSQGSGRLEWAEACVSADHPLTSRVLVNRLWHHLFGRGIVASVDNFGVLGTTPTHPELLDHLALTFVEDGWSIKRALRRLALSRTYRQASHKSAESEAVDPTNSMWHRMEVRRLQGEAIRDAMLAISGRLDETRFGPSVPVHLTDFMQGRGRPGVSGPQDGAGRRSIYQEVRRNFLPPMMLAFDAPIPFNTVGQRNTSNVPAQALILLNDPFVHEQAERWANRLLTEEPDANARIRRAFLEAFTREPTAADQARARAFLAAQTVALGGSEEMANDHAGAWRDLCHALWNVKNFVYLD